LPNEKLKQFGVSALRTVSGSSDRNLSGSWGVILQAVLAVLSVLDA
jgi:hypothetical protein